MSSSAVAHESGVNLEPQADGPDLERLSGVNGLIWLETRFCNSWIEAVSCGAVHFYYRTGRAESSYSGKRVLLTRKVGVA